MKATAESRRSRAAQRASFLLVQIAKARGAHVIATARARNHAFLAELGVDETIDYTHQDVGQSVRGADVMLDLVGGETGLRSLPALRDGGLLITVPSGSDVGPLRQAAGDRVRVTGILVEPDRTGMEAIAALVEEARGASGSPRPSRWARRPALTGSARAARPAAASSCSPSTDQLPTPAERGRGWPQACRLGPNGRNPPVIDPHRRDRQARRM